MPTAVKISAVIGFVLFVPFGLFTGGGTINPLIGLFGGAIGSIVGGALAYPFCLVLGGNRKQEFVDRSQGLKIIPAIEVKGLWRFNRSLVIDPENAVFPPRCIFTNEIVEELLPFTIGDISKYSAGSFVWVDKQTEFEYLPISKVWLQNRKRKGKVIQKITFGVSLIAIVVGLTGCIISGQFEPFGYLCSTGVVALLVSFSIPKLADFSDNQELYSAYFFDDGKILIPKPHPEYIGPLPRLKAGFFHGFVGIEDLMEKCDE